MFAGEGTENCLEGVSASPLLLPLLFSGLCFGIDALTKVLTPLTRDLAGLGKR